MAITTTQVFINGVQLQVANGLSIKEQLDETLDSGSLISVITTDSDAYAPSQSLNVYVGSTNYYFVILSDSVSLAALNPTYYIHNISYIERNKLTAFKQIRNTIFSQPSTNIKAHSVVTYGGVYTTSASEAIQASANFGSFELGTNEKVNTGTLLIHSDFFNDSVVSTIQHDLAPTTISVTIQKDGVVVYTYSLPNDYLDTPIPLPTNLKNYINSNSGVYTLNVAITLNNDIITPNQTNTIYSLQADLFLNTYYYTLYDIIDILNKQTALDDARFTNAKTFVMPPAESTLYTILKRTIAPNFTFTQSSLFDALSQVFKVLDGIFTLSGANVLGIIYFNDNTTIANVDSNLTGIKKTIAQEDYVNNLVCYYQNGRTENFETYPNKVNYAPCTSSVFGVPNNNSWIFKTPHLIENIENVNVELTQFQIFVSVTYQQNPITIRCNFTGTFPINLTPFVYSRDIWEQLDSSSTVVYTSRTQLNTIYFSQNTNFIYVGDLEQTINGSTYSIWNAIESAIMYQFNVGGAGNIVPASFGALRFQVVYRPVLNGRTKIEQGNKFNGDILTNQNAGQVNIERLGLNMEGQIIRLGNQTITTSQKVSDWSSVVHKGYLWQRNDGNYYANVVDIMCENDGFMVNVEWSKNFNRKNSFVQLDQVKRFSEISDSLTIDSEDNYNEYVYLSTQASLQSENLQLDNPAGQTTQIIKNNINSYLGMNDYVNGALNFDYAAYNYNANEYLYLPLTKYVYGNMLCFEMKYDSPISAGTQLQVKQGWWSTSYYAKPILYTATNGFANTLNLYFAHNSDSVVFTQDFPILPSSILTDSITGQILNLAYYKKPNEIFGLNYGIVFLAYNNEQIYLSNSFLKKLPLISDSANTEPITGCKILYSTTQLYSIFDTEGVGTILATGTANWHCNATSWTFTGATLPVGTISWALVDSNNNIIVAVNETITTAKTPTLNIFYKHTKISI